MLKLNFSDTLKAFFEEENSNTTLVKVKSKILIEQKNYLPNSNTTLVKVKLPESISMYNYKKNSNTTLVKVKLNKDIIRRMPTR